MLGLFGPKSDKIGAHRAALAYQGPFKKDFSTGFRVINPSCPLCRYAISSRSEGRLKPSLDREDTLEDTITTTYYLCEEFLKAIGHRDDPQARLSTAEVMSTALAAEEGSGGNIEASRSFLDEYGYIPKAISKSRFNRRLHAIDSSLWQMLFDLLAEVFK